MDNQKLFEIIDGMKEECLDFFVDVLNRESPTNYKKGVDAVGDYFVNAAKKQGFDVEINHQEVAGNAVCITMNGDIDAPPVCLSGHMDTVHPVGSFGNPTVKIENGIIHAPGAFDCKGGIVAAFFTMLALKKAGFRDRPVKLILQSDEEVGSSFSNHKTVEFMCEKAKGALAFLNVEGEMNPFLTLERKGILTYTFTVKGKAIHAAACHRGANAVLEASHKIIELEKFKNPESFVVSCGTVSGGTATNVVPAECKIGVDIRINSEAQAEQADKAMKEIASKVTVEGTSCTCELIRHHLPMVKSEKNFELYEKIRKIYIENGFGDIAYQKKAGGSDAAYPTAKGIPTVDSIGVIGCGSCHTLNEAASFDEVINCIKRLSVVTALLK